MRADRAAVDVRRKIIKVGIALVAALGAGVIVISASLRIVSGSAEGLAVLFGRRAWLGDLATGVLLLVAIFGGCALYVARREKRELEDQIEKYEARHKEHRERHGTFVGDA